MSISGNSLSFVVRWLVFPECHSGDFYFFGSDDSNQLVCVSLVLLDLVRLFEEDSEVGTATSIAISFLLCLILPAVAPAYHQPLSSPKTGIST